jgi:hypothetical protein
MVSPPTCPQIIDNELSRRNANLDEQRLHRCSSASQRVFSAQAYLLRAESLLQRSRLDCFSYQFGDNRLNNRIGASPNFLFRERDNRMRHCHNFILRNAKILALKVRGGDKFRR